MDLNLTEDQETIRDVFAAFFDRETGPERARAAEPFGFDSDAWDRLKETGAPGMGVPEAAGGAGAAGRGFQDFSQGIVAAGQGLHAFHRNPEKPSCWP
mgnify:CR=1 FL=1